VTNMRWKLVAVLAVLGALAAAEQYDASIKVVVAPAIAVDGDDIYVGFARLDRTLKLGRFSLADKGKTGPMANLDVGAPLSSKTSDPFAMVVGDAGLFLGWTDESTGKVTLARFTVSKSKITFVANRTTSIKAVGGVSLALDGDRLFCGYTDGEDKMVKVMSFAVGGNKITQENERKLTECATVLGGSVAVYKGMLFAAWINSDKKIVVTTYRIEDSSKGASYAFLKDTRTEIKAITDSPFIDRPVLSAAEGEITLGYIDKLDKSPRVNFYLLKEDGALKSTGEARVNLKAGMPIGVAATTGGKYYVAAADTNKALFICDR